jgi:hypothetical protein
LDFELCCFDIENIKIENANNEKTFLVWKYSTTTSKPKK